MLWAMVTVHFGGVLGYGPRTCGLGEEDGEHLRHSHFATQHVGSSSPTRG